MRGAFAMKEGARELIDCRTLVLVDGVYTSGATANACARLLKRSGAGAVNNLCWARVVAREDI